MTVENPIAMLVEIARQQGWTAARLEATERRIDAQEARLAELSRRAEALAVENDDLRETLRMAHAVLNEVRRVCTRFGWQETAGGLAALEWLEHVLSLGTVAGWPSVN